MTEHEKTTSQARQPSQRHARNELKNQTSENTSRAGITMHASGSRLPREHRDASPGGVGELVLGRSAYGS